ncbi:MAG: DUF3786 domain-containing protein [Betaproteobacteria bacterium]
MAEGHNPGEDKAWEILAELNPDAVCRAAAVAYDAAAAAYMIRSFGMDFAVSVREKTMTSSADGSNVLLQKLGYFFRLSLLWYLVSVKDVACTGRLVKLEHIRGGDIFTKGSHILPLEKVAEKYGKDKDGYEERGKRLGAELVMMGDVSLRLLPLPRIPVILTLWLEDEEFPARVDLLFDSTCDLQLPTDIVWSVAMMTVLMMSV